MITVEVETIDKEKAHQYLSAEHGNNRPFSAPHLIQLIGRQQRGEWKTNGDSIRFDADDQLRDGQHRLRMVVDTGIPIDVVVVRNIDPVAFMTMDVGKRRNLSDVLHIAKEDNSKELAPTLNTVWRYLYRKMTGTIGSHEQVIAILDDHPQVRDSVAFYRGLEKPPGPPGWQAISMTAHYLFSRVDAAAAEDFMTRYVTGENLESGSPILLIRGQVVSLGTARTTPQGNQILSLLCRAWNTHRAGKEQKQRFQVPKSSSASPRIVGFPSELFLNRQLPLDEEAEDEEVERAA